LVKAKPVPPALSPSPRFASTRIRHQLPLSLRVQRNAQTDHVERMFVTEVPEGSSTDRAGVKWATKSFPSTAARSRNSPAVSAGAANSAQILIDRRPGAQVEFELLTPGDPKPRHITLTARPTRKVSLSLVPAIYPHDLVRN